MQITEKLGGLIRKKMDKAMPVNPNEALNKTKRISFAVGQNVVHRVTNKFAVITAIETIDGGDQLVTAETLDGKMLRRLNRHEFWLADHERYSRMTTYALDGKVRAQEKATAPSGKIEVTGLDVAGGISAKSILKELT